MTTFANAAWSDWDDDAPPLALPRIELIPAYHSSAAEEALDLANACGLSLLPWQCHALAASLGERADGQWASREVAWVVPRQNGKTHAIAARVLAGLFLFGEGLVLYTAHEFKTALELFHVVIAAIKHNPATRKLVRRIRLTHGEESVELKTGQRFKVMARTRASGRGFAGDCVILDEALELRDDHSISSLIPTLSARVNPQLWYVSSAGDGGSVVLATVRGRAIGGYGDATASLCYLEWSAPGSDAEVADPYWWAQANPGYPLLINHEAIQLELRSMPRERFLQERLGVWSAQSRNNQIPTIPWRETTVEADLPAGEVPALAFDVTPDRAWATVVACYWHQGLPHLRLSRHAPGDGWLMDELWALSEAYGGALPLCYDESGPARDVGEDLRARGVPVQAFKSRDLVTACGGFLSAVVNHTLSHQPDPVLDQAADSAGARRMGEAWAWTRRDPAVPITALIGATLAWWSLTHPPEPPPEVCIE